MTSGHGEMLPLLLKTLQQNEIRGRRDNEERPG